MKTHRSFISRRLASKGETSVRLITDVKGHDEAGIFRKDEAFEEGTETPHHVNLNNLS